MILRLLLLAASLQAQSIDDAIALARQNRLAEAARILKRYPDDPRSLTELAGIAYRRKDHAEARRYLHRALRRNPGDAYANEFLALLYWQSGNLAAALPYWNRTGQPLLRGVTFDPDPGIHPTLLQRAVTFSPGQLLTRSQLRTTEQHLDDLQLFAFRRIEVSDDGAATLRLHPATRWNPWIALARALPYQAVQWQAANIAKRAIRAAALYRWDADKRRIDLNLQGPWRNDPRIRFLAGIDARDEHWDDGQRIRKISGTAGASFFLNERLTWTTAIRYSRRRQRGSLFEQTNAFNARLYDNPERDLQVNATSRLRTGKGWAGLDAALHGHWRGFTAAAQAGALSRRLPVDELYQLGMERDNPLWLRGVSAATDGRKSAAVTGTRFLLLQTGYLRPVLRKPFLRAEAGPFFDTGRIQGRALHGAGVQVAISPATRGITWTLFAGRDLSRGRMTFYSTVSRVF